MPFMTIPEAAVLWHISTAELRQFCETMRFSARYACISAGLSRRTRPVLRNPSRILNLVGGLSMAQTDLPSTAA